MNMVVFSLIHIKAASKGRIRMASVELSAPVPVITPQPILGLDDDVEMELYPAQHNDQGYPAAASAATNGVVSVNIAFNNDQNPQLLPEATAQPTYGANASRQGCTDVICLPLFIALMACFVVLSSFVLRQGNPDKLFLRNGQVWEQLRTQSTSEYHRARRRSVWETRTNIWYPLQFDATSPSSPAKLELTQSVRLVSVFGIAPKLETLLSRTLETRHHHHHRRRLLAHHCILCCTIHLLC